jgi:hypothetical protein
MKIDKSKWKIFNFNDIFLIERGDRLKTEDQVDGDIAYISSTKINNGIDNYITPTDSMKVYENTMTLNNSGSIGYCFYHTYKFVASDHCTILNIQDEKIKLDIALFLFLKPIIEAMKSKYGFAREMSNDRLANERILLPALKKVNKYIPDWNYMQKYIKNISKEIIYEKPIKRLKKTIKLDSVKWEEFPIVFDEKLKTGLFRLSVGMDRAKVLSFLKDEQYCKVYEISNTAFNNGVNGIYIDKKYDNKNTITLGTRGNDFKAFYHEYDIIPVVRVINLKSVDFELNKFIALFLCTIFNKSSSKFSYGRFLSGKNILKETILLPVDTHNNPNWNFIEEYIKSLPYSYNIKDE